MMSPNVIPSLMQENGNSWRRQKIDSSQDISEIMTDYAINSANSQDNTCGNNSPLTSEDEQNSDTLFNDLKQGNIGFVSCFYYLREISKKLPVRLCFGFEGELFWAYPHPSQYKIIVTSTL